MKKNSFFEPHQAYALIVLIAVLAVFITSIFGYYQIHREKFPRPAQIKADDTSCQSNNDCVSACIHNDCTVPSCTKPTATAPGACSCLNICGIQAK